MHPSEVGKFWQIHWVFTVILCSAHGGWEPYGEQSTGTTFPTSQSSHSGCWGWCWTFMPTESSAHQTCHFLFSHYQIGTPHYSPSLRSAFWAQQNMPILGVWHNNLLAHRIDSWGLIIHKCKNQCAHHPDRAPRVLSDQAGPSQERLGGPLQILGTNSLPCSIVNFPWLHWQQQHFLHTGTVQFLTSLHRV